MIGSGRRAEGSNSGVLRPGLTPVVVVALLMLLLVVVVEASVSDRDSSALVQVVVLLAIPAAKPSTVVV